MHADVPVKPESNELFRVQNYSRCLSRLSTNHTTLILPFSTSPSESPIPVCDDIRRSILWGPPWVLQKIQMG